MTKRKKRLKNPINPIMDVGKTVMNVTTLGVVKHKKRKK